MEKVHQKNTDSALQICLMGLIEQKTILPRSFALQVGEDAWYPESWFIGAAYRDD